MPASAGVRIGTFLPARACAMAYANAEQQNRSACGRRPSVVGLSANSVSARNLSTTASRLAVPDFKLWNSDSSIGAKPVLGGAWFASVPDTFYRQYATKYRARFGAGPYRLSSQGYDAVLLTVRIARDWPIGTPFPEARLHDAGGFSGIDGAFRFGRDSVAERALEVQEIRGGTTAVVSPAPTGFGR